MVYIRSLAARALFILVSMPDLGGSPFANFMIACLAAVFLLIFFLKLSTRRHINKGYMTRHPEPRVDSKRGQVNLPPLAAMVCQEEKRGKGIVLESHTYGVVLDLIDGFEVGETRPTKRAECRLVL